MVGLRSEIGRDMIVLVLLESAVAQVTPRRRHAELMRQREGFGNLDDFARGVLPTEIDGGPIAAAPML